MSVTILTLENFNAIVDMLVDLVESVFGFLQGTYLVGDMSILDFLVVVEFLLITVSFFLKLRNFGGS